MEDAILFFDKWLRESIEGIMICGGLYLGTFNGDLFHYKLGLVVWDCIQQ